MSLHLTLAAAPEAAKGENACGAGEPAPKKPEQRDTAGARFVPGTRSSAGRAVAHVPRRAEPASPASAVLGDSEATARAERAFVAGVFPLRHRPGEAPLPARLCRAAGLAKTGEDSPKLAPAPLCPKRKRRYPRNFEPARNTEIPDPLDEDVPMAVPKRKQSNSRTGKRRSHDHLKPRQLQPCPQCGQSKPSHVVCPNCGHYMGRQIVEVAQ